MEDQNVCSICFDNKELGKCIRCQIICCEDCRDQENVCGECRKLENS
jgi:hypothetical protein